jgi:arylsulfatase
MPTILDIAGIEHPGEINGRRVVPMQGTSVLDLFAGNVEVPSAEVSQVGYELFGLRAFFDGDWKILWMPPPFGPGEWELFDLRRDPAEMNDLSGDYPDKLAEMIALWERYKEDNGVLDVALDLGEMVH